MPFQAFWLTISPTPHKLEGKSGKQSEVTHPTFGFPEQFDRDYLLQRYVGADLLTRFNECIKTQLEAWIHAWDAPQDNSEIL